MKDKFEELIDYLSDEFDFQPFYEDNKYETAEETIQNCYSALKDDELKDSWEEIKRVIKELENYKGYNSIFGTDWCSGFPCMGYIIFDKDFNYIDFIIC